MSSPKPTNKKLYEEVKEEARSRFKVYPSAYSSQWIVKTYKSRGGKYSGKKNSDGVTRWIKEKWTDEKGNVCGSSENKHIKKCRPTVRVNEKTPVTWSELSKKEKEKVIAEKKKVGMGKRASNIKR